MVVRVADLVDDLPVAVEGDGSIAVTDVVEDSRRVTRGSLFIARPGAVHDGRRFIADAVEAGAAAVLTDRRAPVPAAVVALRGDDLARTSAIVAERFHGCPSRRLLVIGVTGTNGKTTTSHLLRQILERGGWRCGLIGTIEVHDGVAAAPAALTTPSSLEISAVLRRMVENGATACVMEVSSHGLDQGRVAGIDFDGAIFTNLSGDHMDYHGSAEAYREAKRRLFAMLPPGGWAVVNADDPAAEAMIAACRGRVVRTSARPGRQAAATVAVAGHDLHRLRAAWSGPWGSIERDVPLVGGHNAMNLLHAIAAAHEAGVERRAIEAALDDIAAPPGRLEPVGGEDGGFAVLVDYAHTDDALDNVLRALRAAVPPGGRLRVVFGCGGDRDRTKRPRMARVAWTHADEVIVTSDNPRTEDPESIIREVLTGVPDERRSATTARVDRAEAIDLAVATARAGDVVVIAGKGHEDYQIIGKRRRPFDDRAVARAALARRRERVPIA